MIFREANIDDIKQIQKVRHSVKENVLSNSALVTDDDCEEYLTKRGKGWVCEIENNIVGFAIADIKGSNVWALFVQPEFEKNGIGKKLHLAMLNWYFEKTKEKIWLGTAPNTRAATFYRMLGWKEAGYHGKGEIKFEMNFDKWQKLRIEH